MASLPAPGQFVAGARLACAQPADRVTALDVRGVLWVVEQWMSEDVFTAPDLRHAAVSLWVNAGVPATEVARRAGHGVAVLLKVYANCIDGQAGRRQPAHRGRLGEPDSP
jgi:integrase